jgi:hypothetical protein
MRDLHTKKHRQTTDVKAESQVQSHGCEKDSGRPLHTWHRIPYTNVKRATHIKPLIEPPEKHKEQRLRGPRRPHPLSRGSPSTSALPQTIDAYVDASYCDNRLGQAWAAEGTTASIAFDRSASLQTLGCGIIPRKERFLDKLGMTEREGTRRLSAVATNRPWKLAPRSGLEPLRFNPLEQPGLGWRGSEVRWGQRTLHRFLAGLLAVEPEFEAAGHAALEVEFALLARGAETRAGDREPTEFGPLQQAVRRELPRPVRVTSRGWCRFCRGGAQSKPCACRVRRGRPDWSPAASRTPPIRRVSSADVFVFSCGVPVCRLTGLP